MRNALGLAALMTMAFAAACFPAGPLFIECREDSHCGLAEGGHCMANPVTGHKFCAYPDPACVGGLRWSDYDVEQSISGTCVAALVDANTPIDAAIDAMPTQASFALGAVSEWRVGGSPSGITVTDWVRVANTATGPLDLSTARIANLAIADSRFQGFARWQPQTLVLNPGSSAGSLTAGAAQVIVSPGHMPEPAQDNSNSLLQCSPSRG
jgi:hypothetical protein